MSYFDFIPQNTALTESRRIGIYDATGNRVGQIPLGNLTQKSIGQKLYSFGVLSDIHIGESTANDDYIRALKWLSSNTDFICECGDLIHGGADKAAAQIEQYKACRTNATVPVYAIAGNHDGAYVSNIESVISTYSGNPLYYTVNRENDVFIFVGNISSTTGQLFTKAELQWLYETLEANRNKRCFLFQHVRPDDACGNALGVYVYDVWGGTEQTVFESLLRHYHNVIFFHGHSHLKFHMQKYSDVANYDKKFGCHSVHIPSISVPRDTTSVVNPSITSIYADSEGYVVDVYENGIHLRGRDFVKGEFLPIASYWLDTTLQTIPAGTYPGPMPSQKNWVRYSTEADGVTIYNGGKGYKDGIRVRSGGAEAAQDISAATGYIPFKKGDKAYIYPRFTGENTANTINFYDGSFNCLGQVTDSGSYYGFCNSTFKTKVVNGVSVLDISAVTVSGVENVAYVRITNLIDINLGFGALISSGSEMIVTINEEITA